ncbi:MAG TPA: hypothetical protein VND65_15245 [Candidatus Binatia bacterium]|nr:hypothetical protein [Candidatus Binatia bacterium]
MRISVPVFKMKKIPSLALLLSLAAISVGCSSSSKPVDPPVPNVSGQWEFILQSTNDPGKELGLEVSMQEGKTLITTGQGYYAYDGQISASGTQMSYVTLTPSSSPTGSPSVAFAGLCPAAQPDTGDSLTGNVSGLGGTMTFNFTENGNPFTLTGVLDASGTSLDSGTYTSTTGGSCTDAGVIVSAKIVPKLSGTYTGSLCEPLDSACASAKDSASVTLSQSGSTLTVNMVLTGTDNTSFTLTGPIAGNSFFVQGTFAGQPVAYNGYFEFAFDSTDQAYDIQTVDLANSANPTVRAGLLTVPLVP